MKIGGEFLSKKLEQLEVDERVSLANKDIEILEPYTNSKTPFLCRCKVCGHEWKISLSNIISGKQCPKCVIRMHAEGCKKSSEQFIEELAAINPNIEVDGEYKNAKTRVQCHCRVCDNVWFARPSNLLFGCGCPSCWGRRRFGCTMKSHGDFLEQMEVKHPSISVLSEYMGAKSPVKLLCKMCGYEWTSTPNTMLHQVSGCPACSSSHGEKAIAQYLSNHNVFYVQWKRFDDLVGFGGGKLSYDFYIPDLNLLIEYQGEFHDEKANQDYFHNDLDRQRAHDQLKREYAKSNQFQLLEIWYYDFKKIGELLDAALAS